MQAHATHEIATLEDVDITPELNRRAYRMPNFAAEHVALTTLVAELADNPRNMLQRLAEVARDLCGADTAGVSLLDGSTFRLEAVAGVSATASGTSKPSHASPCDVCIDRDAVRLMHRPDLFFRCVSHAPRFVETLLVPFHDHGEPVGTVWIVSQHTGRKFDAEDARVIGVLTHFASAAWQLWHAGEVAAHNEHKKDEFIATLGHELRNPLSVLTTASTVLKMRAGENDDVRRASEIVGRQIHHIGRLVDDLLDMARIENGKLQLEVVPIDLRDIVTNTIESRRPEAAGRKQLLTAQLAVTPVLVDGDPVRLAQVLSNLIDNAIKYTPDAGHITVAVTGEGREAIVAVQDDGAGIPAARAESIFEPFVQLPGSRTDARGGMGLGLALVRRLTELHGGRIDVTSGGQGRGSRFAVHLPMRAAGQTCMAGPVGVTR